MSVVLHITTHSSKCSEFQFRDYFKREAITGLERFLTDPKWLGLESDRLSVTVYLDDDEAANIWHDEVGVPTNRITRMGEDDNFWPAGAPTGGPDGVCGPCSEIYLDPKGSSRNLESSLHSIQSHG